jgi:D-xylulose reductase
MTKQIRTNLIFAQMEPLSVAVHAVSSLANFSANQTIAVFGCGPVGLLCMAVAKALGAARIVAIDIVPSRLEFAKSYAATDTFLPPPFEAGETKMAYSKRASALLKQQLGVEERGPNSLDVVIDASGAEVCIQMALLIAKIGGTFVQVFGIPLLVSRRRHC